MVVCIMSFNSFCAEPHYNCRYQSENTNKRGRLEKNGKYLYCGHVGTDGCEDGVVVVKDESLWQCHDHDWMQVIDIDYCGSGRHLATAMERLGYQYYIIDDKAIIFYEPEAGTEAIKKYCGLSMSNMEDICLESGGSWESTVCDCSGNETLQREGDAPFSQCECKDGFKRGYDKKCWPEEYVDGKCAEYAPNMFVCVRNGIKKWQYKKYNDAVFIFINNGDCWPFCNDGCNRYCGVADKIDKKNNLACPGVDESIARRAYSDGNYITDKDNEGLDCIKPKTQYNYKSCSADSDCTGIDSTVRPYLHSTAWHCAWQSAGVRVCTATACESGWTPINGYCQEDKNTSSNQPKPAGDNTGQTNKPKTSTTTVTQKKACTDPNMDSDCRCTVVAETVERGDKCVCVDGNKEIKNGKCEYTAEYIAKMESELDMKYASLSATIGGLEKSVWRDEEGNFNTARLASDSIAGVVLGTVGGIVTSNLVKKAQVKKGFEDIGCYIGGQSVAGYGDEFTVGR